MADDLQIQWATGDTEALKPDIQIQFSQGPKDSRLSSLFDIPESAPVAKGGPETTGEHVEQMLLRFGAGFTQSLANSAVQLAEIIPGPHQAPLQKRFPGGETGFVKYLEEAGLLQQAGIAERIAQGTGDVAAFFLPMTKASMILKELRLIKGAGSIGRVAADFLPLGIGTYASMKAKADSEGRSLQPGEVGLAAGQVLGSMFVGKMGERAFARIFANAPEKLRESLTRHASNAALGAALEGTGAAMSGGNAQEVAERSVEGALGSIIGAYAAYKLPGAKIKTAKEAETVAGQVSQGLESAQLHTDTPNHEPSQGEQGMLRRPTFKNSDRSKMLGEAADVDPEAWPNWMRTWVEKRMPTGNDAVLVADFVKYGSRRGYKVKELARELVASKYRQAGPNPGDPPVPITMPQAYDMVRAIKAKMGIPSMKSERFPRWAAEMAGVEAAATDALKAKQRAEAPQNRRGRRQQEAQASLQKTGQDVTERVNAAAAQASEGAARKFLEQQMADPKTRALGTPSPTQLRGMFGLTAESAERIVHEFEAGQRISGAAETLTLPKRDLPEPVEPQASPAEQAYQAVLPQAEAGPQVATLESAAPAAQPKKPRAKRSGPSEAELAARLKEAGVSEPAPAAPEAGAHTSEGAAAAQAAPEAPAGTSNKAIIVPAKSKATGEAAFVMYTPEGKRLGRFPSNAEAVAAAHSVGLRPVVDPSFRPARPAKSTEGAKTPTQPRKARGKAALTPEAPSGGETQPASAVKILGEIKAAQEGAPAPAAQEPTKVLGKKGKPAPAPAVEGEPAEPVPVRLAAPEGYERGKAKYATPEEADAAAREWDADHLEAPPAAVVRGKGGYEVHTPTVKGEPSPKEVAEAQRKALDDAKKPTDPKASRGQRIGELETRVKDITAKLGAKLPQAERAVLQSLKNGLEQELALEREFAANEVARKKFQKKAGLLALGTAAAGYSMLGSGAQAQVSGTAPADSQDDSESSLRKAGKLVVLGAGVALAARAHAHARAGGGNIDFADAVKGRQELAAQAEANRRKLSEEVTKKLAGLFDGMTADEAAQLISDEIKTKLSPATDRMKTLRGRLKKATAKAVKAGESPRELTAREQRILVQEIRPFEVEAARRTEFRKAVQQATMAEAKRRKLSRRETEILQRQFEKHEGDIAALALEGFADGTMPKELGARDRFVHTVRHVIENSFGEYGKYLGPKIGNMLLRADQRGGIIEQELKQIRFPEPSPEQKLAIFQANKLDPLTPALSKFHTGGDALGKFEHESATALRDYWVAKMEKYPAEWLPPSWPKSPPKAASPRAEAIAHSWIEYYYGKDVGASSPEVLKASRQLQALYDRVFPATAREAADLDIQIKGLDGKIYPFMERLGPNGKYIPLGLAEYAMQPQPSVMGKFFANDAQKWAKRVKGASEIQYTIVKKLASKYGITEGEVAEFLRNAAAQRHMPLMRFVLDSTIKNAGHLEMSRFIDSVIGSEVDPARFIRSYMRPAIMRFEYAKEFGRSGFLLNEMIEAATKAGYNGAQFKEYLDLALEQAPELRSTGRVKNILREWAGMQTISKLGGSGISQLTSVPMLLKALQVYDNPARQANWKSFFRGFDEAVNKTMVDAGLRKDQAAKVRAQLVADTGALVEAERVNWLAQIGGFFPKMSTIALHMYGTIPLDRFVRNWGAAAGRAQADAMAYEYQNAVRANKTGDVRQIEFRMKDLGLATDGVTGQLDPKADFLKWDEIPAARREEYRNLIGHTVSFRTQHRTRPFDLPKAASSEYGRYLYRFSSFAIRQTVETTRQIRSEILEPRPGESHANYVARTLKWAASLAAAGVGTLYLGRLRAILAEPDKERRYAKAQQDPTFDKIVNAIGYANVAPWAFDWIESASRPGGLVSRAIGPVYGSMAEFGEYTIPSLRKGDPGPLMRYMVRTLGVPGISGQSGTPLGRILGVPSGREIIDRGAEIRANNVPGLRHLSLGRVQTAPGVGPYMRKPKPGQVSYAESQLRSRSPSLARLLIGQKKAQE